MINGVALNILDCEGYNCGVVIRAKKIKVGDGSDAENTMGPVVSQAHFYKIRTYIEIGKEEVKLVFGGNTDDSKGFFLLNQLFLLMSLQICESPVKKYLAL
ncbi:aldehyde dehydrogenase family protein [Flavobacterium succinicans]|uniref:1-pyrroline-5-carboxylate dehydrogenase n=1 Tax=Flavobacterium succinicans TaxID=29536 RepID=A0A199XSM4_9FLAO|nr:aldehyde dehydrogenase family protein [Flavobacterium succinicans]OAZ04748.1 1-pyrroline-5-carboxylate dehydrogenase [Flavobacterium succinicans]